MRMAIFGALTLISATGAPAATLTPNDLHEITKSYATEEKTGEDGSSTSNGRNTILERVVAVRNEGVEFEYDLPRGAKPEERARQWQFPARVLKPADGPMRLLNAGDLEARLEIWLAKAGWDRSVCGKWFFTWNAFHIDCDPQSVMTVVEDYDLLSDVVRIGAAYVIDEALGPGTIAGGPKPSIFFTTLRADPAKYHQARAEADVAVGEMIGKPITLEAALRERAKENVAGTITVTFETERDGTVRKRTKTVALEVVRPDGRIEHRTATETVERRPVR